MGKVDFAFDHIKDNHEINELSVVLYTDSFFYGLWDTSAQLVKTGYHPLSNLEGLISLWTYYYKFQTVRLLSTIKPYVHLLDDDFEEDYFDLYFEGLYNLERAGRNVRTVDNIRKQDISTLHLVEQKALALLTKIHADIPVAHISTAMVNYCHSENSRLLCFIANNTMHVTLLNKNGFRLYNQYDCYYEQDYLYFLLVIFKQYKLDQSKTELRIGGSLDKGSELYDLLASYFKNISFLSKPIALPLEVSLASSHYSDLHLCKTCV